MLKLPAQLVLVIRLGWQGLRCVAYSVFQCGQCIDSYIISSWSIGPATTAQQLPPPTNAPATESMSTAFAQGAEQTQNKRVDNPGTLCSALFPPAQVWAGHAPMSPSRANAHPQKACQAVVTMLPCGILPPRTALVGAGSNFNENPTICNDPLLMHGSVRHGSPAAAGPCSHRPHLFLPWTALCAKVLYCAAQAAGLPAGRLRAVLDKTSAGQKAGGA